MSDFKHKYNKNTRSNEKLKEKYRNNEISEEEHSGTVIGRNAVRELLKSGRSIDKILVILESLDVVVKIIPIMQDILFGTVRQEAIWHAPLIRVTPELMPVWQQVTKRVFDIVASLMVIIVFSPLYIFTAIMLKMSSPGPIFYKQERIGKHGKPFNMLKFRSMYVDAESMGPQLSKDNDPRITPWGRFMRKTRLDEIPQFFTV